MDIKDLMPRDGADTLRIGNDDNLVVMENFGHLPKGNLRLNNHGIEKPELYAIPADGAQMFGPESYHLHDYGFFNNFKQNVADRIKAYMEKK